ncbi:hypothetical protein TrVE_jg12327 [Triparma verrucosa]|uniref:histone deacetylase n=3 Tax=Triparma TaxID=722752 RepID=A0A9W7AFT6_9STRA|nr:hypothetical protein TrST_g12001 [Triparma strigata]GMI02759.1 hypothetical protein TrVE_jg12327 [Triparma verrucosa]
MLFAGILGWAGDEYIGPGVSFFTSSVGGGLGWALLGGEEVRVQDLPEDGGKDAKFVVDRPARVRSIISTLESSSVGRKVQPSPPSSSLEKLSKKRDDIISKIHDSSYVSSVKLVSSRCESTGKPQRLRQSYSRTLVDKHSNSAALAAASTLMYCASTATNNSPSFAVVRPPSHHATHQRGMGGCLLNSVACAAFHSLEKYGSVGIVDFDAHHGNGIANCVQEEVRIKYVSIHEGISRNVMNQRRPEYDPRSPSEIDTGPNGNIKNIELSKGGGRDAMEAALTAGLEFLEGCDILLVAAGFDAHEKDVTSGLMLKSEDYKMVGEKLREFGTPLAVGLEGGYTQELAGERDGSDSVLSDCLLYFVDGIEGR